MLESCIKNKVTVVLSQAKNFIDPHGQEAQLELSSRQS